MEEEPEEDGTEPAWALAVGGALMALTCLIAYGLGDGSSTAGERLGYVVGSLLVPFALAVLGRFLWVRFGSGRPPVMNLAWLLLITGILGVVLTLARVGDEAQARERAVKQGPR